MLLFLSEICKIAFNKMFLPASRNNAVGLSGLEFNFWITNPSG